MVPVSGNQDVPILYVGHSQRLPNVLHVQVIDGSVSIEVPFVVAGPKVSQVAQEHYREKLARQLRVHATCSINTLVQSKVSNQYL